jgi:hypothetical protein
LQQQPQQTKSLQRQIQEIPLPEKGSDENTYSNCVKVRTPSSPTPSTPPTCSKPPILRADKPTRYGNIFSPLCLESSPLDAYVCPLFTPSINDEGHPSQIELDSFSSCSKSSPTQEPCQCVSSKTPAWLTKQSEMLRSSALGVGLRKKAKKPKVHLPCMDSYANVTPTIDTTTDSHTHVIKINHIQFNPTTNVMENPVQIITHDSLR